MCADGSRHRCKLKISVVIPAYNEAQRLAPVVEGALKYADEVVVVDDGSRDDTVAVAEAAGARAVRQQNAGYIAAVKRGFREAQGDVIVTMDADGEHCPEDIPRLVEPILNDEVDLVLGVRSDIPRPSERFVNWLTNLKVRVSDSGTGFRALRRDLALELKLEGRCICGISVLEPATMGARIVEVPITLNTVDRRRRTAWYHVPQIWYVLKWLVRPKGRDV